MISGKRHIPSQGDQSLVTFSIQLDGKPLSRAFSILQLGVDKVANRIASASIQLHDGRIDQQDFPLSSSDLFVPGSKIQVLAGYHHQEEMIFKGIIVKHAVRLWRSGETVLEIMAKDEAVHLVMGRKNAVFKQVSDADAFAEIVDNYSIQLDAEETPVIHEQLVQYQSTDWDFLLCRAEANGQIIINSDGVLQTRKPVIDTTPKLSLTYGATLFEFEEEIDVRNQWGTINTNAWDAATQSQVDVEATTTADKSGGNLSHETLSGVLGQSRWNAYHAGVLEEPELQVWADGLHTRSQLSKNRGMVCCQGTPAVLLGDTIELIGLGDRFDGLAIVSGVQHKLGDGDWQTYLQLGLSVDTFHKNRTDISAPPAGGLLPAVSGMHTGIVTQLAGDPAGEDRIRVRIPLLNPSGDGLWARLATLDAGANRGSIFRPEIGDEVLLSFLNNDPRQPAIVGMLHSSANPAPIVATDENNQKGYVSRSGLQLLFDDEKTAIQILTPAGNEIRLDETEGGIALADTHGNSITLNEQGISLQSARDISIQAQGEINIEAVNVNAIASANLKASGNASAELIARGTVKVQGALVQIN